MILAIRDYIFCNKNLQQSDKFMKKSKVRKIFTSTSLWHVIYYD